MAQMVPDWRPDSGAEWGGGPRLAPFFWALAIAFVAYQVWLIPTLTDWVSSAVDEGYTWYAAQRIREGAWPHRDFFFLWTPGTAAFHALLELAGLGWRGERMAALAAFLGSAYLVLQFARSWAMPFTERATLALLLGAWSFSLWNIPYSSWYAVFFALAAMRALPRTTWGGALLFALAFWFKQNVGILACVGSLAALAGERRWREAGQVLAIFAAGLAVPFALIGLFGGWFALTQTAWQVFLFPLRYPSLMGKGLEAQTLAAPLTALGLWMLSLFFLRADSAAKSARLVQMGVLAYVGIYASRDPDAFSSGGFFLLSLAAWPLSLALGLTEKPRGTFLAFWLPALGIFLQVFPRFDFQHFLFVFPIVAFLWAHALARLSARYPQLPAYWVRLPVFLLLLAGLARQAAVVDLRREGSEDSLGRISAGAGQRLDEEVVAVWRYLKGEGLRPGDPILVLPNATAVYVWTHFRNPTAHPQFFPGYVEGYGDKQANVLPVFRAAGGRFLVVQERSGLETDVPELYAEIQRDYEVVKSFPEHFTIYAPKFAPHGI